MAIESEKSQIGWSDLGDSLICSVPGVSENLVFNLTELHESWKDFIVRYGIAQWIGSDLAKLSIPIGEELKEEYQRAKRESMKTGLSPEELKLALAEFEDVKALVRAEKVKNAKAKAGDVKTVVFNMMKALKVQRVARAKSEKESKAQIEARVKQEMLAKMRVGFEAMGLTEEQIEGMLKNL